MFILCVYCEIAGYWAVMDLFWKCSFSYLFISIIAVDAVGLMCLLVLHPLFQYATAEN